MSSIHDFATWEPLLRLVRDSHAEQLAAPAPSADPALLERTLREQIPDAIGATEEETADAEITRTVLEGDPDADRTAGGTR
ncbi:hypothetical protein [Streptomyces griseosporeus]|uniref:hypothetical protein n=1 Tax=Streptomyces griseosporeus TaxID=1910 RepID=UPI0036FEF78A